MSRYSPVDRVPAQPFSDWLNGLWSAYVTQQPDYLPLRERERGASKVVAKRIGWPPDDIGARRIYRYRRGLGGTKKGRLTGQPRDVLAWIDRAETLPSSQAARESKKYYNRIEEALDTYPREVVEEALFSAGLPFAALYPEIVSKEDVPLEPERWCSGCADIVTPVNSKCPWCEGRREFARKEKQRATALAWSRARRAQERAA